MTHVESLRRRDADNGVRAAKTKTEAEEIRMTIQVSEHVRVERAAVALYRLDHPAYLLHDFEAVPLLQTVLEYRKRAWVALRAADAEGDA